MSPLELMELIKTLKASGVTHFKQGDLELNFDSKPKVSEPEVLTMRSAVPVSLEKPPEIPEKEVPHIVQEMKRLITATDDELVDMMFPLPKAEEELTQ